MYKTVSAALQPLRDRLINHRVFHAVGTLEALRVFMEHHVFAVWDFMSLLKALQRQLTCVNVPWLPTGDATSRRLINEIVLEEESDEFDEGGYRSHFEVYRQAMVQCGACTVPIYRFVELLRRGQSIKQALSRADVPSAAGDFVRATWAVLETGSPHRIAAAFTFGREDLIPGMFRSLIADLGGRWPQKLSIFHQYLERHVHLDEEHHSPMAVRMLQSLCQDDARRWRDVEETARFSLEARLALWDGVDRHLTSVTDLVAV